VATVKLTVFWFQALLAAGLMPCGIAHLYLFLSAAYIKIKAIPRRTASA
jgi:hypothetical protein